MKIAVAISGASGAQLGLKLVDLIPSEHDVYLVASDAAVTVLAKEHKRAVILDNSDIAANIASGSFGVDITMVVPCSMNTLAKINAGIADTLITRAASVAIKERKTLLLAPREIPFSPIALNNMTHLSHLGVIIAPPVMAYYSGQTTLEEMETYMIGKWFDLVGIPNTLYKRWGIDE